MMFQRLTVCTLVSNLIIHHPPLCLQEICHISLLELCNAADDTVILISFYLKQSGLGRINFLRQPS